MSGLDYLRSLRDGHTPLPPMYRLFNFRFLEVEPGHVAFQAIPAEYQCNPVGIVHGGFACTALDSAAACAILTLLPVNVDLASLEVKVNFVRPIKVETGSMRCEANVIHAGQRVATADGRIVDGKAASLRARRIHVSDFQTGPVKCHYLRPLSRISAGGSAIDGTSRQRM